MIYVLNSTAVIASSGLMYWFGRRYAVKEDNSIRGAIIRSICWSVIFCWTLIIVGGGVVPAMIPLPSWGALVFWLLELKEGSSSEVVTLYIPHTMLSPAIPLGAYLIAFRLYQVEANVAS